MEQAVAAIPAAARAGVSEQAIPAAPPIAAVAAIAVAPVGDGGIAPVNDSVMPAAPAVATPAVAAVVGMPAEGAAAPPEMDVEDEGSNRGDDEAPPSPK